jgi:hypothetical protein
MVVSGDITIRIAMRVELKSYTRALLPQSSGNTEG